MSEARTILLFGASARAAAFSALRAGLRPWCADLFADADLRQCTATMQLPGSYPDSFADWIDVEIPGPWMYTSGLENRPFLVRKMARRRPLWGNDQASLLEARSPFALTRLLQQAHLPGPFVWAPGDARGPSPTRRWLVKPLAGSGGAGIRFFDSQEAGTGLRPDRYYLQEFLEGESRAAIYIGNGRTARLLGVTRQLVGEGWLHAAPFHYCGSIGPLALGTEEFAELTRLGNRLASGCRLRGLFGVDGIWHRKTLWPVEVNPRYTASVEVIEYATGLPALAWHGRVFEDGRLPTENLPPATGVVGKAVLFARDSIIFPGSGPWEKDLRTPVDVGQLPAFADIPLQETAVQRGHPVLTFFARATDPATCAEALRAIARDLDGRLYGA